MKTLICSLHWTIHVDPRNIMIFHLKYFTFCEANTPSSSSPILYMKSYTLPVYKKVQLQ